MAPEAGLRRLKNFPGIGTLLTRAMGRAFAAAEWSVEVGHGGRKVDMHQPGIAIPRGDHRRRRLLGWPVLTDDAKQRCRVLKAEVGSEDVEDLAVLYV